MVAQFDRVAPWAMYFALEYFLTAEPRPPVGAAVAGAKEWWRDNPILPLLVRDYFARRAELGDVAEFGSALDEPFAAPHAVVRAFLERVNHPLARALVAELDEIVRGSIDRAFLTTFGRFWADRAEPLHLVEPDDWRVVLATAAATLQQRAIRPLLVSGERLVGKTSFLRLLAGRVTRQGWSVFEASGADLMAGQQWFGQLEGRIRQTVDELTATKKLIWYIPDLLQLARSGTHQGQSASILDQILPAIVAGRLVVWTEATPTSTAHLLQMRPALRSIFAVVRLEPQSEAETLSLARAVVRRMSERAGVAIDPQCADVAVSSARQYLGAAGFPGSAIQLHQAHRQPGRERDRRSRPREVLETLSQLTGLPISILDNKERIDLASIRAFFASRVIGQDEAITSVVERIAMLKAGLNDPERPIGVFLFAGPTGTGKTELAKTAAEYLFGSDDRLIRLDMSEFQTAESTATILGSSTSPRDRVPHQPRAQAAVLGGLAGRVREGASAHLGPVSAGVRRCAADRHVRPGRRLPPLPHHHDHQSRRDQPPDRGLGLCAGGGCLHDRADHQGHQPDLSARVPEPDRQDHRVPSAHARSDARDPAQGA